MRFTEPYRTYWRVLDLGSEEGEEDVLCLQMRSAASGAPSLDSTSKYLAALGAALNAHGKGFTRVRIDIQALDEVGKCPEEVLRGLVFFLRIMVGPGYSLYDKEIYIRSRNPLFRAWIEKNVRLPTYAKGLELMDDIRVLTEPVPDKEDIAQQTPENGGTKLETRFQLIEEPDDNPDAFNSGEEGLPPQVHHRGGSNIEPINRTRRGK